MYNPNNFVNFGRQTKIVEVNGINGANAYSLAPNSNVILLDTSLPLRYLVSFGYIVTRLRICRLFRRVRLFPRSVILL